MPTLWRRLGARLVAFAAHRVTSPIHNAIHNPRNVRPSDVRSALVVIIEDVAGPLSADFAGWAFADGAVRVDGTPAVEGLRAVDLPALFVAGAADRLAPPESVRAAYARWGADAETAVRKRFLVLCRAGGLPHDYGHGDLAIGRDVVRDVFEPVASALCEASHPPDESAERGRPGSAPPSSAPRDAGVYAPPNPSAA